MMENNDENTYNIILFGSYYVGKSFLINRYINHTFDYLRSTDQNYKDITIRNQKIRLKLSEVKYQSFKHLEDYHFDKADGIFFVYDVTYRPSLTDLRKVIEGVDLYLNNISKHCKILIGCKSDSYRAVTETQGRAFAEEFNIPYFETSAKNNTNVDAIFNFIANKILRNKEYRS